MNRKAKSLAPVAPTVAPVQAQTALAILQKAFLEAANALGSLPTAVFNPVALSLPLVPQAAPCPTLSELVREFIKNKRYTGRSERYLRQLKVSLNSFAAGRGRVPVNQITVADVEKWLRSKEWAPKTMRGYLADVRGMLNYALRRDYVTRNVASAVDTPRLSDQFENVCIHTPEQVRQVLETARKADLNVCRHLAIRYFAGVRTAEAMRLREPDIKLDQLLIEVPASKSKTRSRRLVTITPNLLAWLKLGGELGPMSPDRTIRRVIKLSKVPWPNNVTRHSYVSYHVAEFGNAGRTSLEAGNSEAMVFRHYRALVTPSAAREFWAIVPIEKPASGEAGRSDKRAESPTAPDV